jgi:hypothetical protein
MEQQSPLVPTPATEWKGKVELEGTDLLLPSENVARVRQMTPQAFITSGIIPDPLTAIVRKAIMAKQGLPPSQVQKMVANPEQLKATMEMFDRVLCEVVIAPHVEMPPVCIECGEYDTKSTHGEDTHEFTEGPRDPDVLYADTVSLDDKTFIFQWCIGGTRDLERFRRELDTGVGVVPNGKNVQGKAKRSPRRK